MRKLVFVLILAVLVTGSVFAQANVKTNWISADVGIIGIGLRYEYMLSENLSVGANFYVNSLLFTGSGGFIVAARYYPWGKNFYTELGLGLGSVNGYGEVDIIEKTEGTVDSWIGITTTGFIISPGLGWKIDVGEPGGFYIQPGFKIPIAIGEQTPWQSMYSASFDSERYNVKDQTGSAVSFIFSFSMGVAF